MVAANFPNLISKMKFRENRMGEKNEYWRQLSSTKYNYSRCDIHKVEIPKGAKREKRIKEMFEEMMTANFLIFLKLNSDTNLQIHGT